MLGRQLASFIRPAPRLVLYFGRHNQFPRSRDWRRDSLANQPDRRICSDCLYWPVFESDPIARFTVPGCRDRSVEPTLLLAGTCCARSGLAATHSSRVPPAALPTTPRQWLRDTLDTMAERLQGRPPGGWLRSPPMEDCASTRARTRVATTSYNGAPVISVIFQ